MDARAAARWRALLETLPLGVFLFDRALHIVEWNQTGVAKEFAHRVREFDLRSLRDEVVREGLRRVLEGHPFFYQGAYEATFDRGPTEVAIWARPLRDEQGAIEGGLCIVEDRTTREETRRALVRSESRFRTLIERAPDAIGVVRDGVTLYGNPQLARYLGYESAEALVGTKVRDRLHPDDLPTFDARTRERGKTPTLPPQPYRIRRRDGAWLTAEISSMPIDFDGAPALLCFLRDTTERTRLQAQLTHADRLVTIGTLAAGVAHEINNPLAYVMAGLEVLAVRELPALRDELGAHGTQGAAHAGANGATNDVAKRLEGIDEMLSTVREGVERVRDIVRDLKTFARPDDRPRGPIDVRRVLDAAIQMAFNEIRHRAKLTKSYAADLPFVEANDSRLGQVFLNLLLNAAHALGEERSERNEIHVRADRDVAGRVVVTVRDNGVGMDEATRACIFDPFFTTKPHGVGMGLGLSIAREIVGSIGGSIEVDTAKDEGSTFRVLLPAGPRATTLARPAARATSVKRGRVLVVDDEPAVGRALRRMLDAHEVVVADGGAAALELLRADQRFDAIVCDLMMPGVSGIDLYESLVTSSPELARRIVFVSGGAFTPRARAFVQSHPQPILDKPLDQSTLLAAVASHL